MPKQYAIALLMCFGPAMSEACTCAKGPELSEAAVLNSVCAAEYVLIGVAEDVLRTPRSIVEYRILPEKVVKGEIPDPTYAIFESGTTCSSSFRLGEKYVIFARRYGETNYLSSSNCGYTSRYSIGSIVTDTVENITETIEDLCSPERHAERRLEIIRDDLDDARKAEDAAREHFDPQ